MADGPKTALDQITFDCFHQHPHQNNKKDELNLTWEFEVLHVEEGLSISHAENIDGSQAAVFTQAILKASNKSDLIEISIADLCHKKVNQGFGGHCYAVTRNSIRAYDFGWFFQSEANKQGTRYFLASADIICSGLKNKISFLVKSQGDIQEGYILNKAIEQYKQQRQLVLNQFVVPTLSKSKPTIHQITPLEYTMMVRYLDSIHTDFC